MIKKISAILFGLLAFLGWSVQSQAIEVTVGGSVGQAVFAASGSEIKPIGTVKEYGAFQDTISTVFVEVALTDVISVGVDYMPGDVSTPTNTNVQSDGGTLNTQGDNGTHRTNTVGADFQDHTMLYVQAALPFGGYVKLGASTVDVATKENLETGGAYPNVDTTGVHLALGYQMDLDSGIFVRAEVMGSDYDDVSATNSNHADISVQITDMIGASASLRIGKTF